MKEMMLLVADGSNLASMPSRILYLVLGTWLCFSCSKKTETVPVVTGFEYFPLSIGDTAVYQITKYDTAVSQDVQISKYYLKEVVTDTFRDPSRELGYKIDRFKTANLTSTSFVYDSTWYAYKNSYQAVYVENNVPFVKLSFPVKNNISWNGNLKNAQGENMYKMINVDRKFTVGTKVFDRSLLVLQSSDTAYDRIVGQNKRWEAYAAGVGLVEKGFVIISINSSVNPPARSGINFRQKIISYVKK